MANHEESELQYEVTAGDDVIAIAGENLRILKAGEAKVRVSLSPMFSVNCGEVYYGVPQTEGNITYSVALTVDGGILSYTVAAGEADAQGTIKINVTTDNYEDFVVTINVKLVDQKPVYVKEGTEVTLKKDTLTYGEALSALESSIRIKI